MAEFAFHHLSSRTEQGILVLTILTAEINEVEVAESMRDELQEATAGREGPSVVVDFQNVKYLATPFLQTLLTFRRYLRERGGQLILCSMSPEIAEVFMATKLVGLTTSTLIPFGMAPDVPTAVGLLNRSTPK